MLRPTHFTSFSGTFIFTAVVLFFLLIPASAHAEEFTLDNGLRVSLIEAPGANAATVVTLFDIGGDHDPEGKSGLTHLLEHLYVTSAAGDAPRRDVREYVQNYPMGWNAQTGARYTVVATIFKPERMHDELIDAAARLNDLKIVQEDLDREIPRVIAEVGNMFAGHPPLAAFNHGVESVRPTLRSGRRGGAPAHVEKITVEDLQSMWKTYYKPINTRLIIAAPNAAALRDVIVKQFQHIESGTRIDEADVPGESDVDGTKSIFVHADRAFGAANDVVAVALRAPLVHDELFAPFIIGVARLMKHANMMTQEPDALIQYPVLDGPEVMVLTTEVREGETPSQARSRLDDLLARAFGDPISPSDVQLLNQSFGYMLGTIAMHPMMTAQNPYYVAFSTGRRDQMKLDGDALAKALDKVDDASMDALRNWILDHHAIARLHVSTEAQPVVDSNTNDQRHN